VTTMSKPRRVLLTPLAISDDQGHFVCIAIRDPVTEEIVDTIAPAMIWRRRPGYRWMRPGASFRRRRMPPIGGYKTERRCAPGPGGRCSPPYPPNLGGNRAAPPELGAGGRAVGGGVAEALFRDGLCLPSGTAMSEGDQMRVVDVIRTQIK